MPEDIEIYDVWFYCRSCLRYTYQRALTGGYMCGECKDINNHSSVAWLTTGGTFVAPKYTDMDIKASEGG